MKLNYVLAGLLSTTLWSCGDGDKVSRPNFSGSLSSSDATPAQPTAALLGVTVPTSITLDLLTAELESLPRIASESVEVNIVNADLKLDKLASNSNFFLCSDSMSLKKFEISDEDLQKELGYVESWTSSADIDATFTQQVESQGITIYLSQSTPIDCPELPFGFSTLDRFDVVSDDKAVIFVDQIPPKNTLGEAIAHSLSMMLGYTDKDKIDFSEAPFGQKINPANVMGRDSLRAIYSGLPSLDATNTVNVDHLDYEIKQQFAPGVRGLPGIDKVLTLITLAGAVQEIPATDAASPAPANNANVNPTNAVDNLTDVFVNNSGALGGLANLANITGQPGLAAGISVVAGLLGSGQNNTPATPTPQSQPEPTTAIANPAASQAKYLPDLAAFMQIEAKSADELLSNYRATHSFILQSYDPMFQKELISLLKLATAQAATRLPQ